MERASREWSDAMRRANSAKEKVRAVEQTEGKNLLTFGRRGVPHLRVLQHLVQLGTSVLISARATVRVVAVPAFGTETEEDALLCRLSTFALNAGVRAGKAPFAFL